VIEMLPRALLASLLLCLAVSPAVAAKKNVVLIVADDLSLDLGCYGNAAIKTPHLDGLAREGTLYTHAFCTTASCSPSRSVLLTGM
jgi:N-sulfoglucosamine sulfohydrolase